MLSATVLYACVTNQWTPTIGDPNLGGWLTVGSYAICTVLAVLVVRQAVRGRRERHFWIVVCGLMLFLGINKQLDLQSALTATGRCLAKMQGWYQDRRGLQVHFIESLLAAAVLSFALCLYLMRRHLARNGVAVAGLVVVACFVAVRAVGFHHVDILISQRFLSMRLNFVFENAGLVLIALNAVVLLMVARRSAR
jgi:hypothetical protein